MEKIIGGIKRQCYPLTPAQMVHMYTLKFSPTDEVVNIGTGQFFKKELNIAALREALNRAVERCESMRLRLWRDPETDEIWQYVMPYKNQFFEYYDFSDWDEETAHSVMQKWTSQPFDTYRDALSRIVIVSLPDGYNGYYLNVHHVCADSASVIAFTKDVLEIYCSLMYHMPEPQPTSSYIESVERDLAYSGSKREARDTDFWHKELKRSEPMFTDFTGPGRLQTLRQEKKDPNLRWCILPTKDSAGSTITYSLDVDSTNKIIEFAEKNDIPVSAIILHAIRTVLCKFNNNETDITIKDFISRRSSLANKRCGGVRMHCLPLRTIVPLNATVLESMEIIKEQQQKVFMHADYSVLKYYYEERLHYGGDPGASYHSVAFTYQPASAKALVPYLRDIPFKSRWYTSGRQPQPFYVTAMHRPGDGGLNFYFGYQFESATPQEIEFLYYYTGRVLFRSIENPDKTIQDIMNMV